MLIKKKKKNKLIVWKDGKNVMLLLLGDGDGDDGKHVFNNLFHIVDVRRNNDSNIYIFLIGLKVWCEFF